MLKLRLVPITIDLHFSQCHQVSTTVTLIHATSDKANVSPFISTFMEFPKHYYYYIET